MPYTLFRQLILLEFEGCCKTPSWNEVAFIRHALWSRRSFLSIVIEPVKTNDYSLENLVLYYIFCLSITFIQFSSKKHKQMKIISLKHT